MSLYCTDAGRGFLSCEALGSTQGSALARGEPLLLPPFLRKDQTCFPTRLRSVCGDGEKQGRTEGGRSR